MKRIEIYWSDLTQEKQKEILSVLGDNGNYDLFPIATIEFDEEENEENTDINLSL